MSTITHNRRNRTGHVPDHRVREYDRHVTLAICPDCDAAGEDPRMRAEWWPGSGIIARCEDRWHEPLPEQDLTLEPDQYWVVVPDDDTVSDPLPHLGTEQVPYAEQRTIGGVTVTVSYDGLVSDDPTRVRAQYAYRLDAHHAGGWSHTGQDFHSGVLGRCPVDPQRAPTCEEMMATLLVFLSACAESGENSDLFPAIVRDWAEANQDEISMIAIEIEEG